MKKILTKLFLLAFIILGSLCTVSVTHAASWLGSGTPRPVGGGPYYGSNDKCSPWYNIYCVGMSWIYYAPTDKTMAHAWEPGIGFQPWGAAGDIGSVRIPTGPRTDGTTICPNGFWHFGMNAKGMDGYNVGIPFSYFLNPGGVLGQGDWFSYTTRTGGWGHLGSYAWGTYADKGGEIPYINHNGELDHGLWSNGDIVYFSAASSQPDCDGPGTECVWTAYVETLADQGRTPEGGKGSYPSDLFAFCYDGGAKKVTVNYVGYDKKTDEDCWGNQTTVRNPESGEMGIADSVTLEDEDGDGIITYDTLYSELIAQGWEPNGIDNATLNGDNIQVNVANGSVTVTLHFKKEQYTKHTEGCDIHCVEWAPQEYLNSNTLQGETKVRIGVINYTLKGYNDNGEWHHETAAATDLRQGPIYAKPTDDVQWKYCYYPGTERAANEKVTAKGQTPNVDKEHEDPLPSLVNHQNNDQVFKDYNGWEGAGYKAWSENIKASSEYPTELGPGWHDTVKTPGDDDVLVGTLPGGPFEPGTNQFENANRQYLVQPWEQASLKLHDRGYYAQRLDPGWTLWGHIMTEFGYTHVDRTPDSEPHRWPCNEYACPTKDNPGKMCKQTCQHDDVYIPNHKDTHKEQDDARVIVPYNYKNKGSAAIVIDDQSKDYLYAGETVKVEKPSITVGIRPNEVTSPDVPEGYATQVPGRARIVAFLMDKHVYEADRDNSFWNGPVYKEDQASPQPNKIDDGDEGVVWRDSREVCGTNGQNNAFNAKNGVCKYLEQYGNGSTELLNENSNFTGAVYNFRSNDHTEPATGSKDEIETYNVFDEAAGNYFCVAAAVYPFSVNSNTDTDPNGDYSWYISKPSCKIIAKKPTFQVWGAGVFSNGKIETSVSVKNNVLDNDSVSGPQSGIWDTTHGYNNMTNAMEGSGWSLNWYPLHDQGEETLFGSWGELDVTAKGIVNKMASGAGTGYRGGYLWTDSPWDKQSDMGAEIGKGNPGGVQDQAVDNFCFRSTLTIANIGCPGGTGNFAQTEVADALTADKEYLLDRFTPEGANVSTYDYITDPSSLTNGGTINVPHGKTVIHVVPSGTTIRSNIHYDQSSMRTLSDVPKYFIRAQGDLKIDCSVTRLDAVIIADGTVTTCDNADVNSSDRAHQLVVNGTIVANRIEFNRSFGMGTGIHTMTPAELINYDSSIYLWANRQAEGGNSGQMTEATIRELAPRY